MGGAPSVEKLQVALLPLAHPVAAIAPRFCEHRAVTLQEKSEFFGSGRVFQDLDTKATRFTVESAGFTSRKTLLDANETPIVNYKGETFSTKPTVYVHAGTTHDGEPLFQIYAEYHSGDNTLVKVEFKELLTGVRCELGFTGHWRRRDGYFWIDKGRTGRREPVAKIYCPPEVSRRKYHLEIAPNMDTALVAMICNILGRLQRNQESG